MLINETQKNAHTKALKALNNQAMQYLNEVDNPYSTMSDVAEERAKVHDAIDELRYLNDLMNHTVDEDEHLKQAFKDWIDPKHDSYRVAENIIVHTDPVERAKNA